jgi:hypothetical protein
MFSIIENLANDVDAAWSRVSYAEENFCEIAGELLSRPLDLSFGNLAVYICQGAPLPEQRRLDQGFGEPAITLYYGKRFLIEALCWHTSTPAIHQHAFSGAFRVLTGKSMHSRYSYTEHDCLSRISLGVLERKQTEILDSASTVLIRSGRDLIHANFHLDTPAMTIVVRTHETVEPELVYLPPGVAYDPSARSPALHKRLQLLDTLHQIGHESCLDCLHAAITNSDAYDGMAIVMRAGAHVSELTFRELTQGLGELHGAKTLPLITALKEERRRGSLVRLRSTLISPDSRFFLASLVSFSRQKDLLDAMALYYGDTHAARERISSGVASLLGGDADRQLVSATATQAILDGVPVENFPKWAGRVWKRLLSDNEAIVLVKYYRNLLEHPWLTPLVT